MSSQNPETGRTRRLEKKSWLKRWGPLAAGSWILAGFLAYCGLRNSSNSPVNLPTIPTNTIESPTGTNRLAGLTPEQMLKALNGCVVDFTKIKDRRDLVSNSQNGFAVVEGDAQFDENTPLIPGEILLEEIDGILATQIKGNMAREMGSGAVIQKIYELGLDVTAIRIVGNRTGPLPNQAEQITSLVQLQAGTEVLNGFYLRRNGGDQRLGGVADYFTINLVRPDSKESCGFTPQEVFTFSQAFPIEGQLKAIINGGN